MITTLSNGVRISNHHPYGRTWQQFIREEANKEANREDVSREYRVLPVPEVEPRRSLSQWFARYNPMYI
jgi:hypothetical protein